MSRQSINITIPQPCHQKWGDMDAVAYVDYIISILILFFFLYSFQPAIAQKAPSNTSNLNTEMRRSIDTINLVPITVTPNKVIICYSGPLITNNTPIHQIESSKVTDTLQMPSPPVPLDETQKTQCVCIVCNNSKPTTIGKIRIWFRRTFRIKNHT